MRPTTTACRPKSASSAGGTDDAFGDGILRKEGAAGAKKERDNDDDNDDNDDGDDEAALEGVKEGTKGDKGAPVHRLGRHFAGAQERSERARTTTITPDFVSAIAKFLTNFLPRRRFFDRSTVSHLFVLLKLLMQGRRGQKGDGLGHVVRLQWPQAASESSHFVSASPNFLLKVFPCHQSESSLF